MPGVLFTTNFASAPAGMTLDVALTVSTGRLRTTGNGIALVDAAVVCPAGEGVRTDGVYAFDTAGADNILGPLMAGAGTTGITYSGVFAALRYLLSVGQEKNRGIALADAGPAYGYVARANCEGIGSGVLGYAPTSFSFAEATDYRIITETEPGQLTVYIQRVSDSKWMYCNGEWNSGAQTACFRYQDASIVTDGRYGLWLTAGGGSPALSCDSYTLETYTIARTPTAGIAYVRTTGNDATAVVGNSSLPFVTLDAALDAVTSNSTLNIGTGRFAPPTLWAIGGANGLHPVPTGLNRLNGKTNITFAGAGRPTIRQDGLTLDETTGTVIDGPFCAFNQGLRARNLGVDSGKIVCDSRYGGASHDSALWCYNPFNALPSYTPFIDPNTGDASYLLHPPKTGVNVQNVVGLVKPGVSFHCNIFENCDGARGQDIYGYLGFANVIKATNSTFVRWYGFGNDGVSGAEYGLVGKSNYYAACHDTTVTDVVLRPFAGTAYMGSTPANRGTGSIYIVTTDANSPTLSNFSVDRADIYSTVTSGKAVIAQAIQANITGLSVTNVYREDTVGITLQSKVEQNGFTVSPSTFTTSSATPSARPAPTTSGSVGQLRIGIGIALGI